MADTSASIAKAKAAGYSDAEIAAYLSKSPAMAAKVSQAKQAGYTDAQIVAHLSGSSQQAQKPAPKTDPKFLGIGAAKGFANFAGMPGDMLRATTTEPMRAGITVANALLGKRMNAKAATAPIDAARDVIAPTSSVLQQRRVAAGIDGTPTTTGERYLQTIGEFSPNFLFPGAAWTRAANVVVPAVMSQRLGDYAKGSKWEGLVRAGGAALGGFAVNGAQAVREAAKAVEAVRPPVVAPEKPMGFDQLKAAKDAAYKQVDQAGIRFTPDAYQGLAVNIGRDLAGKRINPRRTPAAYSAMEDIIKEARSGKEVTLTELDQWRQIVRREVLSKPDKAERYMGERIIKQIDDFAGKASASDVAGNVPPEQAVAILKKARDLNTRVVKYEAVSGAREKALRQAKRTGSGGNVNNATRQQIDKVGEKQGNWTPEERAAIDKIVLGDATANAARQVGKLSPQGNGLSAGLNLASAATLGPAGAIPGATGMVAKWIADAITNKRVDELLALIAKGGENGALAEQMVRQRAGSDQTASVVFRTLRASTARQAPRAISTIAPSVQAEQRMAN